jgi:hypothetical protein
MDKHLLEDSDKDTDNEDDPFFSSFEDRLNSATE